MLMIAGVLAAGIACQWIAWRIRIPAILPLLAVGLLAGPIFLNILHPQDQLGSLYFPFVSLSVAVILFEGALTLNFDEVRNVARVVQRLLVVGALVTWFGGAIAAYYILSLPWDLSLLFGALIIVTGPTVIAPLLRNVRPSAGIASVLRWEGILIDPIGALMAVLVFDYILSDTGASLEHAAIGFARIVIIGSALGFGSGYLIYASLRRYLIPDYLRDVSVLALVAVTFAISNAFAAESGLLAVTVMGIVLANTDLIQVREIWSFKERMSVLLISTLFILLAANITPDLLALLDWRSVVVLAVVMLVLRPIGVQLSAVGSGLSRNERTFLSWIAPRGIVAAAVSSLFAFELVRFGYTEAAILSPLTFLIIVGTVLIQGSTANFFARRLGVSEADPQGFLLMGGFRIAQEIGLVLQDEGFAVRLVDTNYENISMARMRGLNAYHGNILSEYTEERLDLSGIGRLLALTRNDEANALACRHMTEEFGSSEVYQLYPRPASRQNDRLSRFQSGRLLFGADTSYDMLVKLLSDGAQVKRTALTEQFTYEDFRELYSDNHLVLLAIQGRTVNIATVDAQLEPQPGWTLISLIREEPEPADADEIRAQIGSDE
jgi:NhaP-type Na+/H+ or K+/H+ antiporter